MDPWGLGLYGTNLSHGQAMVAKRREICNDITYDPPLIYKLSTFYKTEVILRDPEPSQDMDADAQPAAVPSPATGSGGDVTAIGGDVTAPAGNIYLNPDAMEDDEVTERAEEISSEEQRHDDQDVDMGQAAAAEVQTEDVPPTVTFR